jgi:two-component system cell cycle sensor histidine kinase/response regulator CckA
MSHVTRATLDTIHLLEAQRVGQVGSWEFDHATARFTWSDELFALYGIAPTEFGGSYQAFLDVIHPQDRDAVDRAYSSAIQDRQPLEVLHRLLLRDGQVKHVLQRGLTYYDDEGRPLRSLGTAQDISSVVKLDHELRLQREALAYSPAGVALAGPDGRLTSVNDQFLRMWGYPDAAEVVGRSALEFWVRPEDAAGALQSALRGARVRVELEGRRRDGRTFTALVLASGVLDDAGRPLGVLGQFLDVTEQRHLEAQLRRTQKLEALGRLASGVAHDFNNLLAIILTCGHELRRWHREGTPADPAYLDDIVNAARTAGDLTRQLLAFSRQQRLEPVDLDLGLLLSGTERMLRRVMGHEVVLATRTGPGLWPVRADPGQLEQVALNLALNARDAMPEGGRLQLEADNAAVGAAQAASHPGIAPGDFVRLTVRDEGVGMDGPTLARAFDPFFTTKGEQGTGLGLATVYGIVTQSGGFLEVTSAPGRGTTFEVYLPRVPEPPESPASP